MREQLRRAAGREAAEFRAECLGAGDAACGLLGRREDLTETVLRLSARDPDRSVVERFARLIVPLVTSGPQGTTGYFDSRPEAREVFGYWPTLVPRNFVHPKVAFTEV